MNDETGWKIRFPDERTEKKIRTFVQSEDILDKRWKDFETDVSANPYYHPDERRIIKLKGKAFPPGLRRYRKDPIRVVYYPQEQSKIVYPLEAARAPDISYKKQSTRKVGRRA